MNKSLIILAMACMTTLGYIIGSSFGFVGQHPTSQEKGLSLFEVELAKPFPVEPLKNFNSTTSSPITNIRVPLAIDNDSKLNFVSDFQVTIDNDSDLVGRVRIERGFISKDECTSAIGALIDELRVHYPAFQFEAGKSSYFKTVDDLRVYASCSVYERSPYVTLEFYLESNSVAENIMQAFATRQQATN